MNHKTHTHIHVCKKCKSPEVARCKWVNSNNNKIYDADSGTTLEWCMACREQTEIILKKVKITDEKYKSYI